MTAPTPPPTDAELAAMRRRCDALEENGAPWIWVDANAGPAWRKELVTVYKNDGASFGGYPILRVQLTGRVKAIDHVEGHIVGGYEDDAEAGVAILDFIAHSAADLPRCLDEIARLKRCNELAVQFEKAAQADNERLRQLLQTLGIDPDAPHGMITTDVWPSAVVAPPPEFGP